MKCDELEKFDAASNADLSAGYDHRYAYEADEVDAAIAELKAENERLKKCEIWMKQHFYCEEVIACESAKNRRLKRALWLARADRGRDNSILLPSKFMRNVWDNVERKCRAKAEEYK